MVQDSNGFGYISMGYDITTSNVRKINFRTHQVVWEKTVDGGNQSYWGEPDEEYFNGAGKCVLTKDEKYLYVISGQDADDYTIHKFRASDGAIVWQAGDDMHSGADGCFPTDIAVDSDGNAYVTYYQPSTPLVKPAIRRYNYDDGDIIHNHCKIHLEGLKAALTQLEQQDIDKKKELDSKNENNN